MTTPLAQEITPSIYRVPIPVPLPLKFVNCYLVRGATGWAVVDCGMRHQPAEAAWAAALDELGFGWGAVGAILVTHHHPDHYGAAGWMQELTGAPVLMPRGEVETVGRTWSWDPREAAERLCRFFLGHGMPPSQTDAIFAMMLGMAPRVLPQPTLTAIDPGARLRLGGIDWEVIHAPGHTDAQVCLYDPAGRVLLAADHILPAITPNISLWPYSHPNPLREYLASLPRMAELDADLVLPGHREPWRDLAGRCRQIIAHHGERLDVMQRAAGTGRTAFEVSAAVFPLDQLTPHQVRFAMAETLAHLVYLESLGRVRRGEGSAGATFADAALSLVF